eukprot:1797609-Rhodomonas_salina.1
MLRKRGNICSQDALSLRTPFLSAASPSLSTPVKAPPRPAHHASDTPVTSHRDGRTIHTTTRAREVLVVVQVGLVGARSSPRSVQHFYYSSLKKPDNGEPLSESLFSFSWVQQHYRSTTTTGTQPGRVARRAERLQLGKTHD